MSKGTLSSIRAARAAFWVLLLAGCAGLLAAIDKAGSESSPRGEPRLAAGVGCTVVHAATPSFVTLPVASEASQGAAAPSASHMARTETTVAQFVRYLNATGEKFDSPQVDWLRDRYRTAHPDEPVAYVSYEQALAYARWLSADLGRTVDLPTEAEWEYAARAGVHGAPFPWGWGEPARYAHLRGDGVRRTGSFSPNRFGLYDLAGNVAEWCRSDPGDADQVPARGGSWADRSDASLRIDHRTLFPRGYRDADVGFRVVLRD